jgi:RimJ/RimL family protein N-acetyltransferase
MNKKSSSRVPSESPLSRGVSRIRYLGLRAIPRIAVYRLLSGLFQYRATRCVWADLENWRPVSSNQVPFEIRVLSPEEIKSQAELIGEDPNDVDQAIAAGGEALGALKSGSVASYVWISPYPPALNGCFALEFDERLAFFYRAFTLPQFRGMGLMPAVLRAALERCAHRGYRGAVACIDIANRPSWNAFRSAGFSTIATFRYAKIFGKHRIQPAQSERTPRFRVQRLVEKSGSGPSWSE